MDTYFEEQKKLNKYEEAMFQRLLSYDSKSAYRYRRMCVERKTTHIRKWKKIKFPKQ